MKINNGDTNKISVYITGEVKEPHLLITDPGQSLCQLYDRYELENIMTENSFIEEFQWSKHPIEEDTIVEVMNKNDLCFGKRDFIIGKDEKVKDEFIYDKEKPECVNEKKICGCRSVKLENENPVLKEAIMKAGKVIDEFQDKECERLFKEFHSEELLQDDPNYIDEGYIPELLKKYYKDEDTAKKCEPEFRKRCENFNEFNVGDIVFDTNIKVKGIIIRKNRDTLSVTLCTRMADCQPTTFETVTAGNLVKYDSYEDLIKLKPEPGERGKIIVLEGIDCSFKETQSKMLLDLLTNIGIKTTLIGFPTYDDESSVFVKRFLNGDYGDDITPELISIFYALNRYDIFNRENIQGRLDEGEWFIFDRYTYSNVIHQCARYEEYYEREELEEYIYDTEFKALGLPEPDLVLYLYSRNFDLVVDTLSKKKNKDKNELDISYLSKCDDVLDDLVIHMYDYSNAYKPHFDKVYIDKDSKKEFKTKEQIHEEIKQIIIDVLFKKY